MKKCDASVKKYSENRILVPALTISIEKYIIWKLITVLFGTGKSNGI